MSRYVHYSDVATCQDISILLNCVESSVDMYQQETVKKRFMQGLNLKRILGAGPCCMSAPVSPLCRILDGCSTMIVCKREEVK